VGAGPRGDRNSRCASTFNSAASFLDRIESEVFVTALNAGDVVRGHSHTLGELGLSQPQLAPGLCRTATKAFSKTRWGATRHCGACVPPPPKSKIYL
jgi:hypothetical protein